jgi:predicted alpha-1,6-mannanase (GH76 family)
VLAEARSHLRSPLAPFVAIVALNASGCAFGGPPQGQRGPPAADPVPDSSAPWGELDRRADRATQTLLDLYWSDAAGSFLDSWPSPGGTTGYWTFAQAADAVLDAVERTGGRAHAARIASFYAAQDRRGWRSEFFDDEAWMAMFLLRAHAWSGDPAYLARARWLVEDIAAGAPDRTCCGPVPGGLWWDRAHTQKATAANAGAALAAALLYQRTGEARWLSFARDSYAWWRSHMVDAGTARVADHLDRDGTKVWWRFSYNEGVMIGAAVALHRATGDPAYLHDARRLAAFVLAHETAPTPVGPVLSDGPGCTGDCEQFKGIAHRYLAELAAEDPDADGVAALLEADAAAIWSMARDAQHDIFACSWAGPPTAGASLSAQSAAATVLNLEASRMRRRLVRR